MLLRALSTSATLAVGFVAGVYYRDAHRDVSVPALEARARAAVAAGAAAAPPAFDAALSLLRERAR
jgi:hypothetical protein